MATFTFNISSTDFYVTEQPIVETDCSTIYSYIINATNGDDIDITITGNKVYERYTIGGTETFFNDTVNISYTTPITVIFAVENSGISGVFNNAEITIDNNTTLSGFSQYVNTVSRINDGAVCNENEGTDPGDGIKCGVLPPQLFNPSAGEVISNSATFALLQSTDIVFVTINGQTIDDSEYSLTGSILTVTPDNGFNSISDEILVFQSTQELTGSGFKLSYKEVNANYTLVEGDYVIKVTASAIISLPTSVGIAGTNFVIKNESGGNITINTFASEEIDGETTQIVANENSISIVSDGTNWMIIN